MSIIQYNIPLSTCSTFGIGGPADYFCTASSTEELVYALLFAKEKQLPILIIGNGSNSLFADEGFRGIAVQIRLKEFIEKGNGLYQVGSGFSFVRLGQLTAQKGFHGLEFAAGIPGTVGGAVYMNAGDSGRETKESLLYADVVDYNGTPVRLSREELDFSYRFSALQKKNYIVTSALFQLTPLESAKKDLYNSITRRLQTQPYKDKSCGCIFKNPTPEVPAGKLIDQEGLKGFSIGDAVVSTTHANFIINRGNASSKEIQECIKIVKKRVMESTGYLLRHEIKIFDQYGVVLHI